MIGNTIILLLMVSITIMIFVSSYQFKRGNWLMWIAGYNDLPKEKREKIDGKYFGKKASETMTVSGVFMIIETVAIFLLLTNRVENKLISASIIIVPLVIFMIYVINKSIKGAKYYNSL